MYALVHYQVNSNCKTYKLVFANIFFSVVIVVDDDDRSLAQFSVLIGSTRLGDTFSIHMQRKLDGEMTKWHLHYVIPSVPTLTVTVCGLHLSQGCKSSVCRELVAQ